MSQSGYAIVDVDDEVGGDISRQGGNGLEFRTFLGSDSGTNRNEYSSQPPTVPYSPFNLAYYQNYFDVDTNSILKRVGFSIFPRPGFIAEVCNGQIDLYGPFWTLTTLILSLYTTATLSASISQYLDDPDSRISSNLPLLSTATSVVYVYGLGVPAILWGATKWLGVGEWGLAEALGIYGYAMGVFIPVSLVCLIPVGLMRWVLVGSAAGSSGFFLVQNIYPILASAEHRMTRLLIVLVVGLHAIVALIMKILFFSYSVAGTSIGPDSVAVPIQPESIM